MTKTILLVDDESGIRTLLAATLGADPRYKVVTADDGEEAMTKAIAEAPALIFLDIIMPKMNGHEVCRRLRAMPSMAGTKIVMLTAMTQESARREAREAGADDYFTKPFSPLALLNKVEEVLSRPNGERG